MTNALVTLPNANDDVLEVAVSGVDDSAAFMQSTLGQRLMMMFLLMAYAMSGTAVLPAALALVAEWDSSHQVLVQHGHGHTEVVLHHRQGCFTPLVSDHCQLVARALARITNHDGDGDHSLFQDRVTATAELRSGAGTEFKSPAPKPDADSWMVPGILSGRSHPLLVARPQFVGRFSSRTRRLIQGSAFCLAPLLI